MSAVWERQPHETPKSFAAFQEYLKLSPRERSLRKVAEIIGHRGDAQVEEWSSKYRWRERVDAYDSYMANHAIEVRKVGLTEYQQAITENSTMATTLAYQTAMLALQALNERIRAGESIDTRELSRVVNTLETIDTMQRRNAGMPTSYKTESVPEPDTGEDEVYYVGGGNK